jgi:hypothetical protein
VSPAPTHHVVYQFGLTGKLRGDDWEQIGLGWNNPITGQHELPPNPDPAHPKSLSFPYVVQFDVPNLQLDNRHIEAGAVVDAPSTTINCAITVDGEVVAADPGTTATLLPDGTVDTGGSSECLPVH